MRDVVILPLSQPVISASVAFFSQENTHAPAHRVGASGSGQELPPLQCHRTFHDSTVLSAFIKASIAAAMVARS